MMGNLFKGLTLAGLLLVSACSTYTQRVEPVRQSLMAGNHQMAYEQMQKQPAYQRDEALYNLNLGLVLHWLGEYQHSNESFEIAKKVLENRYGVSVSEQVGATMINDEVIDYPGSKMDIILIHAYMAINYLALGQPDDARVEVMQADAQMLAWQGKKDEGYPTGQDAFVRYLSGIIFEYLGEEDSALVAYRQALDAYEGYQREYDMRIPEGLKLSQLRMLARMRLEDEYERLLAEWHFDPLEVKATLGRKPVIVLVGANLVMAKKENVISLPSVELGRPIMVALPSYPSAQLSDAGISAEWGDKRWQLDLVEPVNQLAAKSLESDMAAITARAMARAVVKYKASQKAREKDNPLLAFGMDVAGMLTERADTRSWVSLPAQMYLGYLPLTADVDQIKLVSRNPNNKQEYRARVVPIKPGQDIYSVHWMVNP